jgi:hypothetical protein
VVRTAIEATVLLAGWLLGGTVGIGTVVYAVCIGPLAHIFVPLFSRTAPAPAALRSEPRGSLRSRVVNLGFHSPGTPGVAEEPGPEPSRTG